MLPCSSYPSLINKPGRGRLKLKFFACTPVLQAIRLGLFGAKMINSSSSSSAFTCQNLLSNFFEGKQFQVPLRSSNTRVCFTPFSPPGSRSGGHRVGARRSYSGPGPTAGGLPGWPSISQVKGGEVIPSLLSSDRVSYGGGERGDC